MPKNTATQSYEYNVLCDVCGFKKKASQVRKRWDGYIVCDKDYEIRHPLDFFTNRNDTHPLPFTRSDNNGTTVTTPSTAFAAIVDPTAAPTAVGIVYVNTLTGVAWRSTGTSTVNDWTRLK